MSGADGWARMLSFVQRMPRVIGINEGIAESGTRLSLPPENNSMLEGFGLFRQKALGVYYVLCMVEVVACTHVCVCV